MEKKLILVIEDKIVVGTLMRDILIATGRYEVVNASNGYQGLLKIIGEDSFSLPSDIRELEETVKMIAYKGLESRPLSRKFDLVLSDIRMPGIDGVDTVKLIRKLCPDQNCVFVTGYGIEDHDEEIEELTPHCVLKKPLTNSELVSAIDEACGVVTQPS